MFLLAERLSRLCAFMQYLRVIPTRAQYLHLIQL